VRALAVGSPMAIRLEHWSSTERAVTLARTPLLFPEAAYVTNQAGTLQAELHGVHQHWRYDDLIIDVARSIIAVRYAFPNATRCFVSFRTKNRTPCFFTVPHEQIPTLDAPVTEAGKLVSLLAAGDHGFAWLEHQRLLPAILGKTGIGRFLNWIEALDISTSSVEYELRELNDISVGWRSRFDAYIISRPRIEDLDNHARPTPAYLKSLFTETSLRWLLRPRSRPMGTKRIRFFDLGMIHVYLQDRRRTELRGSGLTDNLLFRAQIGVCTGPPFLGSSWEKIGQYHVTMNCRGHDILKQLKAKAG